MKLFYLIMAHHNFAQLDRMIDALEHPEAKFIIHIDRKVNIKDLHAFKFRSKDNCQLLKTRYNITWGGYNMIPATLSLISAVMKYKTKGYCVLLSGMDYPVKSSDDIIGFLSSNYGHEYMDYEPMPRKDWKESNGGLDRVNYYWFVDSMGIRDSMRMFGLQKKAGMTRRFFNDFDFYGGSLWWCLTTECVDYISRFVRVNDAYCNFFTHAFCPDEIFFNSVIANSHYSEKVQKTSLRYIVWANKPHPETLTVDDYEPVVSSGHLWMRKLDLYNENSLKLMDKIDEGILIRQNQNSQTMR